MMEKLNPKFSAVAPDFLSSLVASLRPLPKTVRYYDDFDDKVRSIKNFDSSEDLNIFASGTKLSLDFSRFGTDYGCLAKHLFFQCITEDLRISTAYGYVASLQHVDQDLLIAVLSAGPMGIKQVWSVLFVKQLNFMSFSALKWLLVFLSQRHLCGWSPSYLGFISTTLPFPYNDKYSKVRTGDAFLSIDEEAQIVCYLEQMAITSIQTPEQLDDTTLRISSMLMCAYLFGMRPYQIAQVTMRDVRIWQEQECEFPSVHITFKMIKQKRQSKAFSMMRRVKHDWAPLIALLYSRALNYGFSGGDRLFAVETVHEVGLAIQQLATKIVVRHINTTDLRHTGAQRLVDAGASIEEVAAFLGHSDITTCLVYFESSPNQSERVNQALAISPIYQQVAKIAHAKFINPEELAELKEEQQIAGVPHGIPIAGIGGCATGQPSCPYNPITSCYGCRKFMPVTDIVLHQRVLKDMRSVVTFFFGASKGDNNSPAFLQLRRTITSIQKVIHELEDPLNA